MSEFNKLVKLINESEEDYQLIEISRYVENKYEGDKTELRRLIRDKFRPNLDNYPHKPNI
jgi:inorganic pyrophosphatase